MIALWPEPVYATASPVNGQLPLALDPGTPLAVAGLLYDQGRLEAITVDADGSMRRLGVEYLVFAMVPLSTDDYEHLET